MNRRVILIIVIALLLVNTGLLALLWWKKPAFQPPPGKNAKDFIVKELALTNEQVQQFNKMKDEHFEKMQSINRSTKDLKEQIFDQISTPVVDSVKFNELLKQVAGNEVERDRLTVNHFRQLRSILNETQKQKFDKIIKDVMRMMGRPQGPMQGPPRGPRRGPDEGRPFEEGHPPPGEGQEPPRE